MTQKTGLAPFFYGKGKSVFLGFQGAFGLLDRLNGFVREVEHDVVERVDDRELRDTGVQREDGIVCLGRRGVQKDIRDLVDRGPSAVPYLLS